MSAIVVSQTDLTINSSHHNPDFPLIDSIDVDLLLPYTKLPKGRQCTADVWVQINRFPCDACLFPCLYVFISICFSTLHSSIFASVSLSLCIGVSSFQQYFTLCLYWFSVLFWKYWWRSPPISLSLNRIVASTKRLFLFELLWLRINSLA